jgi:hypothetical protein
MESRNVIKSVVKFFGTETDEFGMPNPYYSYLVVASPWQTNDSGVASILPLTQSNIVSNSASAPLNPHHIEMKGGERAAYDKAIKALKAAVPHHGLSFHEHIA